MITIQVNFIYGLGDLTASTCWAVNLCKFFMDKGYESKIIITTQGNAYYERDVMSVFDIIDRSSIPVPIEEQWERLTYIPAGMSHVYTVNGRDNLIGGHWIDVFCPNNIEEELQKIVDETKNQYCFSAAGFHLQPLPPIIIKEVPGLVDSQEEYHGVHIRYEDLATEEECIKSLNIIDDYLQTLLGKIFVCSNSARIKQYIQTKYSNVFMYNSNTEIGYRFRVYGEKKTLIDFPKEHQIQNVHDTMKDMATLANGTSITTLSYFGEGRLSNFLYLTLLKGKSIHQITI